VIDNIKLLDNVFSSLPQTVGSIHQYYITQIQVQQNKLAERVMPQCRTKASSSTKQNYVRLQRIFN